MPSDPLVSTALAALARPRETFHSAIAGAAEEVRGLLGRHATPDGAAVALGAFAAGRIDASRFAGFVERSRPMDAPARVALTAAADTLAGIANARPEVTYAVRLPAGSCLRDAVGDALARLGRAFGAARSAALVRQNRWAEAEGAGLLGCLAPHRWSRRERAVAPPLVVELEGSDLHAGALAEFLDGAQKIVLVVRGPATPAPLARLVSPGVHVLQTGDTTGLDAFAAHAGPGVAALLPEGAAWFAHVPSPGAPLHERITVRRVPEREPRTAVGGISAAQQVEELRWLAELAMRPAAPVLAPTVQEGVAASPPSAPQDATERLAAWLLASADAGQGA